MKSLLAAIAAFLILTLICSFAQADKLLPVPYVHQVIDTPDDFEDGTKACGATSLAMILAYYGKISKPYGDHVPEIHEYVYIQGKGASWAKLVEYAQKQGLDSLIDWSPSFEEVQKEINLNYPLVLSVDMKIKDEIKQHMITVIGYTDSGEIMIVNDPAGYYISWEHDGAAVKYPWDSLELAKGAILVRSKEPIPPVVDWPSHQRDPQNTGNNFCAGTIRNPKLDDKPMTIEGTSAYSQPIVEGHMVYLALTDGRVVASDMERKLCPWFFNTGAEEIKVTPCLFGNKLYVLDSNNVLWCLDKRSGDWIWKFDIVGYFGLPDYYWQTAPQVWQNYVCMTVGPYAVFIYDDIEITSKTPKIARLAKMPIQAQEESSEFVATSAISEDGIFYCFNFACQAIAFKIETGEYLWHISEFPGPKNPGSLQYLGNPFAIVLVKDILILKNNWRYDFQDTEPKPGETGFLYAVDIKAHDKILWAREIGLTSCPSVCKDNALYSYGL
ncbi:MAG: C39 family peptidase, partial [bacterium]